MICQYCPVHRCPLNRINRDQQHLRHLHSDSWTTISSSNVMVACHIDTKLASLDGLNGLRIVFDGK